MAKVSINIIKNWFKNGLKPTQEQFWTWMDSYWHKDEKLPIETVDGLNEIIANKADTEQLTNHVNDNTAHGIPELKKELETGIAEKADTKQLTNHINDNDAHGIPGLKKALETLIATKTDKGGYDGTSKDLKDEIDANKKAFDAYTPPEYNIDLAANQLTLLKDGAKVSELDLSVYLDDTNLARLVSGTLNAETGVLTVTRDDDTTFEIDMSALSVKEDVTSPGWGLSKDPETGELNLGNDEHGTRNVTFTDDNSALVFKKGVRPGDEGFAEGLEVRIGAGYMGGVEHSVQLENTNGKALHFVTVNPNTAGPQITMSASNADSSAASINTDLILNHDSFEIRTPSLQLRIPSDDDAPETGDVLTLTDSGTFEAKWSKSKALEWENITDKPTTFTPTAHNHDDRYYTESESDGRFTKHNASETIGGAWNFTNTELTLSAHLYRRVYDDNNVYDHYYPGLGNGSNYTKAHLRVWNGAGGAKVLNFDGLGNISWDGNKIWHSGNLRSNTENDTLFNHKSYNTQEYLGGNYIGGGHEKPNFFGSGKLQLQMLNGANVGGGGYWNDVLWLSSYGGGDVKISSALVFSKIGSPKIGFVQQDYDSTTWGTYNEIWHSGNFNPSDYLPLTGGAVKGTLSIDFGYTNKIRMYLEQGTGNIADTFADTTTNKSYIFFDAGISSNDPGYIMHETSDSETNEGVLHLCPTDDNNYGDYVSIHGTDDPDAIKLHTDGYIETIGSIKASGNVTANSDKRLKKNIKSIPNALEKVLQLNGCTWDRNDISLSQAGVIAQELQEVLPVAVSEGENGMLSVDISNALPALLIEAIKELNSRIDGITK